MNSKLFILFSIVIASQAILLGYAPNTYGTDIAVGALGKDVGGVDGVGAVYVFNETNSLIRIINNPVGNIHGQFGEFIAYKDDSLVISAPWQHNDKDKAEGATYILDATSASLLKTIPALNPNQDEIVDGFGASIAFLGNKIAIGAPNHHLDGIEAAGSVYVFDQNTNSLLQTINNPDPEVDDTFGGSLASFGNNLAVGIPNKKIGDVEIAGAVSIFGDTGSLIRTIENPDPVDHSRFGLYIAASDNKLLVGAPYKAVDGINRVGVVYLYDGNAGALLQTINNPEPDEEDDFGFSVLIAEKKIIVGAPGNGIFHSGSVHIFDMETGSLLKTIDNPQIISPPEFGYTNDFGNSIAYKDGHLVIGDRGKIIDGLVNAGGVYIYDITTGDLQDTIDNPFPERNDAFGSFVTFVGDMTPNYFPEIQSSPDLAENPEEAVLIPSPEHKIIQGNYYNDELGFGLTIPESMKGFMTDLNSFDGGRLVGIQIHPESNLTQSSCCPPIDTSPAVIMLDSQPLSMLTTPVPFTGDLYAAFQGYNMNMSIEHLNGTEVLATTLKSERDDLVPNSEPIKHVGKFYFMNTDERFLSYGLWAFPQYYQKYIDEFEESAKSISFANAKPVNLDAIFNYALPVEMKLEDGSLIHYSVFSPSIIDSVSLDESSNTFRINITEPNLYRSFVVVNTGDLLAGPHTVTFDGKPVDSTILKNESGEYLLVFYDGKGSHNIDITGSNLVPEFSINDVLSPLKQFKSGIPANEIKCREGLLWVMKAKDGSPACVKQESMAKLVAWGWAKPI